MAVTEKCTARNRATCRFHGALDHARMKVDETLEKYQTALKEYNEADTVLRDNPGRYNAPMKTKIANTKTAYRKALTELDSHPSEYKVLKQNLEDLKNAPDTEVKKDLTDRLARADKHRVALRKKAADEKKQQKLREELEVKNNAAFQDLIKEKAEEAKNPDNSWRAGYKKAVSKDMVENGYIVNGPGRSSYGMYFPDENKDKTAHLKECGALDVRNIQEDTWDEWDFNSMSSVQTSHQEFKVTADATCNCGHIVKEKIQVSGSFSEITQRVLSF